MSVEKVIKCDICGAVRGPGNKWLTMYAAAYMHSPYFDDFNKEAAQHVCSEACCHKALSDWLAEARKRQA